MEIASGRRLRPAKKVHVRLGRTDIEDRFPGIDASIDLRRQYVANELIAERNKVSVRRNKQACELLERHGRAAMEGQCFGLKTPPQRIRAPALRVEPERHPPAAFAMVPAIRGEERLVLVSRAEIP